MLEIRDDIFELDQLKRDNPDNIAQWKKAPKNVAIALCEKIISKATYLLENCENLPFLEKQKLRHHKENAKILKKGLQDHSQGIYVDWEELGKALYGLLNFFNPFSGSRQMI